MHLLDTRKTFAPPIKKNRKRISYAPSKVAQKSDACFYCSEIGHTPNHCYARHFGVPNGEYAWRRKKQFLHTNLKGPNRHWVPKIAN